MKINDFADKLDMQVLTGEAGFDRDVSGVYVCDLLSWVMSRAKKDDAWITVHTHLNIVAVALLAEVSCIIIPDNIEVEEATLKRAVQEGIAILSTPLTAYQVCCKAYDVLGS